MKLAAVEYSLTTFSIDDRPELALNFSNLTPAITIKMTVIPLITNLNQHLVV